MATQPPDPEIENLLAELRSDDADRRKAALQKIAKRKVRNDKIDGVTWTMARMDPDATVRYWADQALVSIGVVAPPAPAVSSSAKAVEPLSRNEKIKSFAIGFVGWYVVNGVIWLPLAEQGGTWFICVLPINLIVLIVLAFKWRSVALGVLSAMALNIVIALILGFGPAGLYLIPFFNLPFITPG